MPLRLRATVHGKVLRRGDDFQVARIVTLHSPDERDGHARREVGIFPLGLLSAPPARIYLDSG